MYFYKCGFEMFMTKKSTKFRLINVILDRAQ